MTYDINVIKEWVNNNFIYKLPKCVYNFEYCKTERLHINFKEVSGIYFIRNINNNKMYIGSTNNLMKRITEHIKLLSDNIHHSKKLQNSINKNGFKWFEVRIYPINKDREFLFNVEEYLIKQYDTFQKGYNMSEDSRCKNSFSEEERKIIGERMRKVNSGKKCSEEHKKKVGIAKSIQNSGEGNPAAKLDKAKVLFIREHCLDYTCSDFCNMFNVGNRVIRSVIHLRSWKYPDCIPYNYQPPKSMKR